MLSLLLRLCLASVTSAPFGSHDSRLTVSTETKKAARIAKEESMAVEFRADLYSNKELVNLHSRSGVDHAFIDS